MKLLQTVAVLSIVVGLAAPARAQAKKPGAARTPSPTGGWLSKTTTSAMDDSKSITLGLEAATPVSGWPNKTAKPVIVLKCFQNVVQAVLVLGLTPMVEADDPYGVTVVLRFDKDVATPWKTDKSSAGDVVIFQEPKRLIMRLLQHETVLLQFTPFNSTPQLTSFTLRGLSAAIDPLYAACGWSPKSEGGQ